MTDFNQTTNDEQPQQGDLKPVDAPDASGGNETPTLEDLQKQGINGGVAAAVIAGDYTALKKAIDDCIADEVESRIKSNIPGARQTEEFSNRLKSFEKMGYKERLELSRKNPRLYNELVAKSRGG